MTIRVPPSVPEAIEIYEADRDAVITTLTAPGSKARNERGALAVSKFKSIGRRVWQRAIPQKAV